ncbi:MAG TPA: protein kinase [Thermoanaerobaculia bacterium]|nr:protein kinase [Thermoanaerobaculia bacterium]
MTLAAGTRLGSYEILFPIGAGGMGEVYKAKDTKLHRDVAIKVLPESLAKDTDALARFEREAHAVAALNHPNILSIHDFGDHDGTAYAVTELLEGETLRETLADGSMPARRALDVARQICAGLSAAHARGIVHRDLKPDNVFVTNDGRVKILDFGLAKPAANRSTPADETHSPTVSAFTEPGTVMGTVGYMSPEQVKGLAVDHRSDLFSFGAVLYEMLSGRRAFQRETAAETMTAVLREDPPELDLAGARVPPALDRIVRHCLEKKPDQRFKTASDIAVALESTAAVSSGALSAAPEARRRGPLPLVAAAIVAAALVGWLGSAALRKSPAAGPALAGVSRFSHDPGISEWPAWSPDGTLLAFASNRSGNFEIYVRRVDGGHEINVTNDPGEDFQPAFSPDGNSIAFVSTRSSRTGMIRTGAAFGFQFRVFGGDLWVVPSLGGQARRLAPDANSPAWDPTGKRIAYVSGPESHRSIIEIPADGGAPRTVLAARASTFEITRIHYSPDGRWISFETAPDGELLIVPSSGGKPRSLVARAASHAWDAKSGRIVYLNQEPSGGTRIETVAVSDGRVAGKPVPIAVMTGILRDTAIRGDGRVIAVSELEGSMNLTRLPLSPDGSGPSGPEEPLDTGHVLDRYPAVSPDGKKIAYGSDRLGSEDLWVYDRETHRSERIELPGKDLGINEPHWSPDGRRIAVTRLRNLGGEGSLWLVAPDGSQSEELTTIGGLFANSGPFSPDGKEILYVNTVGGWTQVLAFAIAARATRQITRTPSDKFDGVWSPDGKWIAFTDYGDGKYRLMRTSSSGTDPRVLVSSDERLRHSFVSSDGRWVYYQPSHRNVWRVAADGGAPQQVTQFPESGLFLEEPSIAPDGSFLVYSRSNGGSSVWLLTLAAERPVP